MAVTYQIVVTPAAQQCLREITEYLLENASVETATKVNQAIVDTIKSLKTFLERYEVARNISKRGIIYRRIMAMSYRIVYTVNENKIQVVVVDIDHGNRNPERLVRRFG